MSGVQWRVGVGIVVWVATLAMNLATALVLLDGTYFEQFRTPGRTELDFAIVYLALAGIMAVTTSYASVGLLLAGRAGAGRISAVLLLGGALFAATPFGYAVGGSMVLQDTQGVIANAVLLIGPVSVGPAYALILPGLALAFPDGRLPSARWRFPVRLLAGIIVAYSVLSTIRPGRIAGYGESHNPFGIDALPASVLAAADPLFAIAILGISVLGVAAVLVRRRGGDPIRRHQLKWFVAAVLLASGPLPLSAVPVPGIGGPQWAFVACVGLILVPVSVWIAVTRYRLFDIDRIVSRTLAYAVMTAVLATVFGAVVLGLQAALSGVTQGETIPVAASTLVVAALAQPLRRRVQRLVDRRFNRAGVDADRTVAAFADRMRDEIEMASLRDELAAAVRGSVQPTIIAVWIRPAGAAGR